MKYLLTLPPLLLLCATQPIAQSKKEIYRFSHDIRAKIEKDTVPWKYQLGATDYSFSQYYLEALRTWDKNGAGIPKVSKEDSLYFKTFQPRSAKDYIIERSKAERIIIINEAHHNSMHRVFTTSLLQNLYHNGYRFFGLEALSDSAINNRKFVVTNSGYYTSEPQMANLINEALKIGYTVFGYEASQNKNGKEREIEQAQNIARVIHENPSAKLLIHCGWEHVVEGTPGSVNWEKAMAGRLKEYTAIDPFTIDQTFYSEKGESKFNSPYINWINSKSSVVMVNGRGEIFNGNKGNNQTDCRIIHPVTKYAGDRPTWLYLSGRRKMYGIEKGMIPRFPALVLAYNRKEYDQNGIPCDIIEVLDSKHAGTLVLKEGEYTIIIKDKNYDIIAKYEVEIN